MIETIKHKLKYIIFMEIDLGKISGGEMSVGENLWAKFSARHFPKSIYIIMMYFSLCFIVIYSKIYIFWGDILKMIRSNTLII